MPFKSKQQARFMFAKKPEMAKEWSAATPDITKLPKKVTSGGKSGKTNNGTKKGSS